MAASVVKKLCPILTRIPTRKSVVILRGYTRLKHTARLLCTQASKVKVKECYLLLGLDWSATVVDVREAYLRLAKLYHPDCGRSTADATRFSRIEQAYRVVMDHVTTAAQIGPEVTDQDFDKEIFDIHHTVPQHRYRKPGIFFLGYNQWCIKRECPRSRTPLQTSAHVLCLYIIKRVHTKERKHRSAAVLVKFGCDTSQRSPECPSPTPHPTLNIVFGNFSS